MSIELLQAIPVFAPDATADEVAAKVLSVPGTTAQAIGEALISHIAPSNILNVAQAETQLHAFLYEFDEDDKVLFYLDNEAFIQRLERDFAIATPAIVDATTPLVNWAIPLLSAFAGPLAPVVSFGLVVVVKITLAALKSWAAKKAVEKGIL